ncbi:MAG TPA: glutaredoxin domain-containing protein [Pseudolabrys sp.]
MLPPRFTRPVSTLLLRSQNIADAKGVSYSEIDLSRDAERRQDMIERAYGRVTVPQIAIGAMHVRQR